MTMSILICLTFLTFHFAEITFCPHIALKTKTVIGRGVNLRLSRACLNQAALMFCSSGVD